MQKSWIGLSLLLFVACQELPASETSDLPAINPSGTAPEISSSPSVSTATPEPSHSASPAPTLPTATPTVTPRPIPTISFKPGPEPTPSPTPVAGDICYQYIGDISINITICNNITGTVYDDEDNPLPGASVEVLSEDSRLIENLVNPPYLYAEDFVKTTVTDENGNYRFRYRLGPLSVKVTKPGYSERNRSCSVREYSRDQEPCDFKRFPTPDNFGYYYDYRLSKKPEVIDSKRLPGDPSSFQLTFSKPIVPEQIQSRVLVSFFGRSYFTVDQGAKQPIFTGENTDILECNPYCGLPVFDGSFFDVKANAAQNELTFTLKPGYRLPNDEDESMDYLVTFGQFTAPYARDIIDLEGNTRNQLHFRVGGKNRNVGLNYIYAYLDYIKLESISAHQAGLRLHYDGMMYFKTLQPLIAGGMADRDNVPAAVLQAPAAYPNAPNATPRNTAGNYTLTTPRYSATWKALGGIAIYAEDDPLHQQVLLVAPINANASHTGVFLSFDTITTAPTSTSLNLDDALTLNLSLIDYTGQTTAHTLNFSPGEANGASGLALRVQSKLNALQKGNWQVEASTDQRSLHITWASPAVDHVAWKGTWSTSSTQLPTGWSSPAQTWSAGTPLNRFRSGENVSVTVHETVLSPEGVPIRAEGRQAQMVWP